MKKQSLYKQTRFQILAVLFMSFFLHACGNKDGGQGTPAPTYYLVAEDNMCYRSDNQPAPMANCQGVNVIYRGQCRTYNDQHLPTIRHCTPSGFYVSRGVCINGDTGQAVNQYNQYSQYGQYGQQQYGGQYGSSVPCGPSAGQTGYNQWNQPGYSPTGATTPYGQQQPTYNQWSQQPQYNQYQQQQWNQQPQYNQYQQQQWNQQPQYNQPTSYWPASGTGYNSGYQYYQGYTM